MLTGVGWCSRDADMDECVRVSVRLCVCVGRGGVSCLIQILSAIVPIREKSVGAHPVHLQISVLLLRRAYTWYMGGGGGVGVQC